MKILYLFRSHVGRLYNWEQKVAIWDTDLKVLFGPTTVKQNSFHPYPYCVPMTYPNVVQLLQKKP